MSKDDFKAVSGPGTGGIATRQELLRLKADRANDPETLTYTHPAPDWVSGTTDTQSKRRRIRERRIRYLENRLDGAKRDQQRNWDWKV